MNQFLSNVVKICAGNEHALALTKSGDLYVWGSANQTGLGDKDNRPTPTMMDELSSNNVK